MITRIFAGVLVTLLLWSTPSFAQVSTGKILGTVQDGTGGVLPGVSIVVRSLATSQAREIVTNERGQYEVAALQAGRYEVRAELPGFRGFLQSGVRVEVNAETRVNVTLLLGALAETITVVGEGTLVATTNPTLGKVVEETQIRELPLSGRNFADLGLLVPGVTTTGQSTTAGSDFNVHGQRAGANNFQLDGVGNVSLGGNDLAAKPNPDSVQEFKIQTSNFSAEFGRNSGSVVQVVTKSGTNQYSGNLWEFHRNDRFQEKDFFALSEPPPLLQNQFGGTFGGPVILPGYSGRNKTFFFGSYEGFRLTRGLTRQTRVATAEQRSGNFSALSRQLIDPDTGQPFAGNIIPPARISAAAQALLTLMPLPNIPGAGPGANNFVASPSQFSDRNQYILRADHNLGSRWTLFYRHFLEDSDNQNPYQGASPAAYLGFPAVSIGRVQHGTAGLNGVISTTMLNEFRYGFRRNSGRSSNLPLLDPVDFGVNYVIDRNTAGGLGLPDFTITGMSGIGNTIQGPGFGPNYEMQVSNVFSKTAGRHSLRMGGELRTGATDSESGFFFNGRFVFNGSYTGDSLADFLIGRAVEFNYARGRGHLKWRNWNTGLFFQDDFKIHDNLTLNLGVRYDYYGQFWDRLGRTSTWVIRQEATPGVPQSGRADTILSGTEGLPKGKTYFADTNNVQPRVGFAWDVLGSGKFAIRGGFGVFHNQLRQNLTAQEFLSYPFYEQPVVRDTTLENPVKPVDIPLIGQIFYTDRNIATPYVYAYSLGYQWEFATNTVLEMAYVGNQSRDLLQFKEINQPIFVPGQTTAANKDMFRPYSGFTSVLESTNWGRAHYNGVETSVQRRFSTGLAFGAAYTLSSSIDNSSRFHYGSTNTTYLMVPQDADNLDPERGPSNFDARHRLVLTEVWEVPLGPGRRWLNAGALSHLLGGWSLSSIWTFQTAFAYNVYDGSDRCLRAGNWTPTCRPNLVGDPNDGPKTPQKWFNTAAFERTQIGQFGNAGRNIVRGPGLANTDLGLTKRVNIFQRVNLELRAEVFNLFNRANLGVPVLDIASGSFGRIGSTSTPAREWQFGVKLQF